MSWIYTKDELPPEGEYVLARTDYPPCVDENLKENSDVVVVKMRRGISVKEREALPDSDPRKTIYTGDDEHGNNIVPYSFHPTGGPFHYFGQSVICWMRIPEID